jgi:hypothetical protein
MRLVSTLGALFAVGFTGLGCQGPLENYPPLTSGCPVGSNTCSPGGGAVMGAGGSPTTTTTGAGGAINQSGTVVLVTLPSFVLSSPPLVYMQGATINVLPSGGGEFNTSYPTALGTGGSLGAGGGATSDTFELTNIRGGAAWFWVQDTTNGATGIYSTYSWANNLPVLPSITLPVVQQQMLMNIASDLPSVGTNSPVAGATAVLMLTLNNLPYSGVSVNSNVGDAKIAYDVGPGTYSDSATATGSGGTIILFNSGLSGPQSINLLDTTTMAASSIAVYMGQGSVTLASADFTP